MEVGDGMAHRLILSRRARGVRRVKIEARMYRRNDARISMALLTRQRAEIEPRHIADNATITCAQ